MNGLNVLLILGSTNRKNSCEKKFRITFEGSFHHVFMSGTTQQVPCIMRSSVARFGLFSPNRAFETLFGLQNFHLGFGRFLGYSRFLFGTFWDFLSTGLNLVSEEFWNFFFKMTVLETFLTNLKFVHFLYLSFMKSCSTQCAVGFFNLNQKTQEVC